MSDHDKTRPTRVVVSAYYRVAPEDRLTFIEAVKPDMEAAKKIPGCIFYAFAADITDENAFHLVEGYESLEAYEAHENGEAFLKALATVVKNVQILHREGVRYDVAAMHIDDPRGRVMD
ncbi:antibiotic biosynthesis monooxygenase [Stenotrophomonas sp. ESTM1D_MKCIP4_1]|uniref:putative quinol monooxygenase n=1 Tax=Stenotrophomonas sp. ESTM1D_MKCIP4_1 TaxID=2072414 RepID=UPI000D53CB51|nr:antibiotic biosynthesis monooxygenase family protein [Stenotrophomonas sp. ESTM1D_MKCIP4_1]AWH55084.1 antibiotic biosynthesis monooxygenase [Stenotrophomonas sp. ESTM1D_MKCIP4_1]